MMSKILTIDSCTQCYHFDNEYYHYNEVCTLLGRHIPEQREPFSVDYIIPIPDDCPLSNTEDVLEG